jgi:solute carrier family 45 protein 1/2/4
MFDYCSINSIDFYSHLIINQCLKNVSLYYNEKNKYIRYFVLDQPPTKSFWVILRLVFFFFAIEFMYAVETALTVPILTSLRVPESYVIRQKKFFLFSRFCLLRFYSMAWLISPILGFFLQPIVGMWSDSCKCRWGRRRPFILAFAIGKFILKYLF